MAAFGRGTPACLMAAVPLADGGAEDRAKSRHQTRKKGIVMLVYTARKAAYLLDFRVFLCYNNLIVRAEKSA